MDNEQAFEIISCGCSNYFKFLAILETNTRTFLGRNPVLYDLGLTAHQRSKLASSIVQVDVDESLKQLNDKGNIQASHKAACIRHFLNTVSDSCLYVDADILFTAQIDHTEITRTCDIAVTPRHPKESGDFYMQNGLINSGVLYFRKSPEVMNLLEQWHELSHKPNYTDQMALSEILAREIDFQSQERVQRHGSLRVRLLDPCIYNDVSCKSGKLLHYKNAARRAKSFRKYSRMATVLRLAPWLVSRGIAARRLMGI